MNMLDEYMKLLETKEDLCDELAEHIYHGDKITSIRHPLLYCLFYSPTENAVLNARLKMKQEAIKAAEEQNDFGAYIGLHERPYRIEAFIDSQAWMTDNEYWETLRWIWTDSENIWQNKSKWRTLLSSKRSNKHLFMLEEDRAIFEALPAKVTVHRGCYSENKNGFSWTLDKEVAQIFAKKFKSLRGGEVITKVVDKTSIFAFTDSRGEQEVIILK